MNSNDFKAKLLPVNQKLYRLCLRFLVHRDEAEDVVQEVYLKLWNMRDKLGEINNLEAFATTVTKNLCLDKLKSRRMISMDDLNNQFSTAVSAETDPHRLTENLDTFGMVRKIIDQLPDQQKSVIMLRDIDEFSFEEIEQLTGLNINTIRVNLSRARKQVRDEIIKVHEYGTESDKRSSGKIL